MVAALAVAPLVAAACGGGGAGSGSSSGQNSAVALDSFASCMRGHGVPGFYFTKSAPSPPPSGVVVGIHGYYAAFDPSSAAFLAAQKTCKHLLPFNGDLTGSGTETHQRFLKVLKSVECMRSHGYPNWPDPPQSPMGQFEPAGVDTSSPQFHAAVKKCGMP